MKSFHNALILALILSAASRVAAQPTVIRPAPYPVEPRLFLFVMDTSSAMKRQAPAARASVASLLGNGAQGRMRRGDLYCVWSYQDTVTTNLMAWERWQPELAPALGSTASKLLENIRHSGSPNQDAAVKAFVQLARDTRELTVFLLNDGSEVLYGTPFDLPVSTIYIEHGKKLAAEKRPFVTTLVARNGEIRAWSVDAAGLAISIPTLPDETPPVPPANQTTTPPPPVPDPARTAPIVVRTESAPKVEPPPPPAPTPKVEPAPPPKVSATVNAAAPTPPRPAPPPAKTEPPVVPSPKTASVATTTTPPAPKPVEPKPPESRPVETKTSVTQPPQPAPSPVAGVEAKAPSIPPAPPAVVTNPPPPAQPLTSPAPVAPVETAPPTKPPETNPVANSPVEPPPAPPADMAKVAPAQTAVMLPPPPGSSTALYLAFGLGLVVAAGAIGFFVLLRRPRATAGGSLISESLDREQREAAGGKPRPRKPGVD
jgi:hypothetical protein